MPVPYVDPRSKELANGELGSNAVGRLRTAFELSGNPMLIADDQRRWVTGNGAACELLGIAPEEVPWHTMNDFTPPDEVARLEEQWELFLANGSAEGWHELYFRERDAVPVEFCATANVMPSRHLAVLLLPDESYYPDTSQSPMARESAWRPILAEESSRALTARERETMTLIASGLQSTEIAKRLFLSPETIKSHAHSAMVKLSSHTRAGAVATALVTGQISWSSGSPAPAPSPAP
jgi:PAS domain S-box-containing protein